MVIHALLKSTAHWDPHEDITHSQSSRCSGPMKTSHTCTSAVTSPALRLFPVRGTQLLYIWTTPSIFPYLVRSLQQRVFFLWGGETLCSTETVLKVVGANQLQRICLTFANQLVYNNRKKYNHRTKSGPCASPNYYKFFFKHCFANISPAADTNP